MDASTNSNPMITSTRDYFQQLRLTDPAFDETAPSLKLKEAVDMASFQIVFDEFMGQKTAPTEFFVYQPIEKNEVTLSIGEKDRKKIVAVNALTPDEKEKTANLKKLLGVSSNNPIFGPLNNDKYGKLYVQAHVKEADDLAKKAYFYYKLGGRTIKLHDAVTSDIESTLLESDAGGRPLHEVLKMHNAAHKAVQRFNSKAELREKIQEVAQMVKKVDYSAVFSRSTPQTAMMRSQIWHYFLSDVTYPTITKLQILRKWLFKYPIIPSKMEKGQNSVKFIEGYKAPEKQYDAMLPMARNMFTDLQKHLEVSGCNMKTYSASEIYLSLPEDFKDVMRAIAENNFCSGDSSVMHSKLVYKSIKWSEVPRICKRTLKYASESLNGNKASRTEPTDTVTPEIIMGPDESKAALKEAENGVWTLNSKILFAHVPVISVWMMADAGNKNGISDIDYQERLQSIIDEYNYWLEVMYDDNLPEGEYTSLKEINEAYREAISSVNKKLAARRHTNQARKSGRVLRDFTVNGKVRGKGKR